MKELFRQRHVECAAFLLYLALWIVISVFHEPWFDEAQAWQIAKCCSLKDILFLQPHYEGHPPLWHLILAVPAKLGVPYEIGLKTVGFLFSAVNVFLLLFKAPFPKPLRLCLPFTYFLFYQYGIIVRPYSIMLLALLLSAMFFKERNLKPWRFILSLILLCLTSAYGIVIAGGICAAWLFEIIVSQENFISFLKKAPKDKRIHALLFIFAAAVLLILEIYPYPDTYATLLEENMPLWKRLIYTFFVIPADCTVLNIYSIALSLQVINIGTVDLLCGAFLGLTIFTAIFLVSDKKTVTYFFVPYSLFAILSAVLYISRHHIGTFELLWIFWLWISYDSDEKYYYAKKLKSKIKTEEKDQKLLIKAGIAILAVFCAIPVYWTITASVNDILHPYYNSRSIAHFLIENNLQDLKIMTRWEAGSADTDETEDEPMAADAITDIPQIYENTDTSIIWSGVASLPYFNKNIFMNLNRNRDDMAFCYHKAASFEENTENYDLWQTMGYPDILIDPIKLSTVYGKEIDIYDYAPIAKLANSSVGIWKDTYTETYTYVFLRRDLLKEYNMEEIKLDIDFAMNTGLAWFYYDKPEDWDEQHENK